MNEESGASFDLSAIGAGVLWGLMLMLAGALIQGLYAYRSPLSPGTELLWTYLWQVLAVFVAGFLAGRRSTGAGWLHGSLAGVGLALAASATMGLLTDLPSLMGLLKGLGGGGALGAVAGIAGVNLSGR